MALSKMCPRCHSKYEYGQSCPNKCLEKRRKADNKVYDKQQRKNKSIYSSARWQALREVCIARDKICIWSYFKNKRVVHGKVVHHIIEIEDDKSKAFNIDNLVFLSDEAHREVHELYKSRKTLTQRELFEMIGKMR